MMQPYDGTEADAMDDSGFTVELDPSCREDEDDFGSNRGRRFMNARPVGPTIRTKEIEYRYDKARAAAVGSTVACPVCGTRFVKTTYHKSFCSNQKTVKRGSCKDKYHNMVAYR